jgi:hypothetical protein
MNKQEPIKFEYKLYIQHFSFLPQSPSQNLCAKWKSKEILPFLITWDYYVYVCVCEQKILIRFSPNSLQTIYES